MEDVTQAVTTDVAPETTAEVTPTNYFNVDGTLNDGWQSTLPDGYKEEKSLSTVKDAKVLARMFVDTKKMVGKNVVALPTETSDPSEWEAYYKAGGRPETAADYNLAAPKEFPQEVIEQVFPKERLAKWQDRFHKGGVSKKAADAFVNEFAQDMLADYQKIQLDKATAKEQLVAGLSAEYGAALDQQLHLGDIAFEEGSNGDESMKESLAYLREDPNAVRLLINLGKKFAEGKPPSYAAIPTPSDLNEQIDALMADPLYMKGTQAQRMKIAEKIMALRNKMYPKASNT